MLEQRLNSAPRSIGVDNDIGKAHSLRPLYQNAQGKRKVRLFAAVLVYRRKSIVADDKIVFVAHVVEQKPRRRIFVVPFLLGNADIARVDCKPCVSKKLQRFWTGGLPQDGHKNFW